MIQNMKMGMLKTVLSGVCLGALTLSAGANVVTSGAVSGGRSAEADFSVSGGILTIDLINTGSAAMVNSDTLTALFFSLPSGVSLTANSAALAGGSTTVHGSIVNNVGEGWAYQGGISAQGQNAGISASGLGGVFDNNHFFYTPAVTPLDGINYGIVNGLAAGSQIPATQGPMINNEVEFKLAVSGNLDLTALGNTFVFQWGTALDEGSGGPGGTPPVSTPDGGSTIALLGLALLGVNALRRKISGN